MYSFIGIYRSEIFKMFASHYIRRLISIDRRNEDQCHKLVFRSVSLLHTIDHITRSKSVLLDKRHRYIDVIFTRHKIGAPYEPKSVRKDLQYSYDSWIRVIFDLCSVRLYMIRPCLPGPRLMSSGRAVLIPVLIFDLRLFPYWFRNMWICRILFFHIRKYQVCQFLLF